MTTAEATKEANIVHVLVPDMEQSTLYKAEIGPNLSEGSALCFSHGATVHWKSMVPPSNIDVIMVAPKGPGQMVRELFLQGFGTPFIGRSRTGLFYQELGGGFLASQRQLAVRGQA